MITPMTKYTFLLLSSDKEAFLEKLQDLGVVDITRSSKPVDEVSTAMVAQIEDLREEIKSITNGRNQATEALRTRLAELRKSLEEVQPWGDFDAEKLQVLGVRFYTCSPKNFRKEWEESYAIEKISETRDKVWFVTVGDCPDFPLKDIPMPSKTCSEVRAEYDSTQKQFEEETAALNERKNELPELNRRINEIYTRLSVYLAGVSAESAVEGSIQIMQGFAPAENDEKLREAFDSMDMYYECEAASAEDNPPIQLKNNAFVRQFEVLTKMYGVPVYNEFDPTVFLSIFFLMFFSMCMGDLGYGLVLIAVGLFLRGRQGGLANMWSLVVTLGCGTVIAGLFMGGFFGVSLYEQSWVPDWLKSIMIVGDVEIGGASYSKQMILSLIIGILHICLAMIVKAVWAVRRDGFKNSLSTTGWTLLIVGGVIGLATGLTGVISESAMKWLLIGIGGVSALGIFIFNKWGRNPLINIGSGLWDSYNTVTGLMSDVLSYIRLYALGLSGGMLASAFNLIAEMVKGSDPTWHWIPFVLILVFGHVLNVALSCLGAFVHPLRLNFVEFFKNSGYEGLGTVYSPIKR